MNAKLLTVFAALLTGCASSGYHSAGKLPGTQVRMAGVDARFQPRLAATLESHGLTVTTNTDAPLVCSAKLQGFTAVHAEASLLYGTNLIAMGSSSNHGWGTWMAHDVAVQGVVAKALDALDAELTKLEQGALDAPARTATFHAPRDR